MRKMRAVRSILPLFVLVALLAGWHAAVSSTTALAAQRSLDFQVGARKKSLRSYERNGKLLYSVKDLVTALGLQARDEAGRLTIKGPEGKLELMEDRPLVRFRQGYVLISSPCWRRAKSDWYAPEDFIAKVLPNILTGRLAKMRGGYRFDGLAVNRVQVEVVNHSDHVTITFLPSQMGSIRVSEQEEHVEVELGEYLIRPDLPQNEPQTKLVSSLEFDSQDPYGTFRIHKGRSFGFMRQRELPHPDRTVIEIYPPLGAATSKTPTRPAIPGKASLEPDFTDFGPQGRSVGVITLDPGHGGEDTGAKWAEEVLEKNLVLQLASQVEDRLKEGPHRPQLTRNRDITLSPTQRSSFANYHGCRAFVSLHAGGAPFQSNHGGVVYVHDYLDSAATSKPKSATELTSWEDGQRSHRSESLRLAKLIQAELNQLYETRNSVVKVPLTVLAPVAAPAVLVEVGFLTHEGDREKLSTIEFQEELAGAIARAVVTFLQSDTAARRRNTDDKLAWTLATSGDRRAR